MRAGFVAPRYLRGAKTGAGTAGTGIIGAGIIAAGSVGMILALAGVASVARGPLVLLFLVAAPTLAVAGLLRGLDVAARYIVAVTAAIAANMLVAESMLAAGVWSPRAGLVVIAVLSAAAGAIGLRSAGGGIALPAWAARPGADGGISSRP